MQKIIDEPTLERRIYVIAYTSYLPPDGKRQHSWFSDFIDCLRQHDIIAYQLYGWDDKVEVKKDLLYHCFPILTLYKKEDACGTIAAQTLEEHEHAIVMQVPYDSNFHREAKRIRRDLERTINGKSTPLFYDALQRIRQVLH